MTYNQNQEQFEIVEFEYPETSFIEQSEEVPYQDVYTQNNLPLITNEQIVDIISDILQEIVDENDQKQEPELTSSFHASSMPKISIKQYINRLQQYFLCSQEVYILSLIYLDRIQEKNVNFKMTTRNIHRLVLTSMVIAAKFYDEQYYTNDYYRKVGGISLEELNQLEIQFMMLINYKLEKLLQSQDSSSQNDEDMMEIEATESQINSQISTEETSSNISICYNSSYMQQEEQELKENKQEENLLKRRKKQKQIQEFIEFKPQSQIQQEQQQNKNNRAHYNHQQQYIQQYQQQSQIQQSDRNYKKQRNNNTYPNRRQQENNNCQMDYKQQNNNKYYNNQNNYKHFNNQYNYNHNQQSIYQYHY